MITRSEELFSGALAKFYVLVGGGLLVTYVVIETRGVVFAGTDRRPSTSAVYSGGRSGGGGGIFFWGSGYRGGK